MRNLLIDLEIGRSRQEEAFTYTCEFQVIMCLAGLLGGVRRELIGKSGAGASVVLEVRDRAE